VSRVALSLRQPWAWLVVHGGKDVENRRWSTRFRGEFLVHAAKGMTADEYDGAVSFVAGVRGFGWDEAAAFLPTPKALVRGGIIGRARLVDVIPPCCPGEFVVADCACGHPWHMGQQFGFVLADVVELPFEPLTGKLGFFDPDTKGWARPDFGDRR